MYELLYKFRYFFSRLSVCVIWCSIFFDWLLSRWYYSTGVSLLTVVALSVRHIIRNPWITGIIRDVMSTISAYLVSITTIVPNLHIFWTGTTIAVAVVTRSFSDGGVFHIITNSTTKTRTTTDSNIITVIACAITVTRKIIDGTIVYKFARKYTVTRASTDIDVACLKASIPPLWKREVECTRRRDREDDCETITPTICMLILVIIIIKPTQQLSHPRYA